MKPTKKFLTSLYEILDSVIMSAVVVLLLFTLVFRIFVVSGPSMNMTLENGDRLIVSDLFYTPKRGDIICFYSEVEGEVLVKRIIATEGQTVDIKDGYVYVDGVKLAEPYVQYGMATQARSLSMPHTVKEGCVFALGDNRANSKDSRYTEIGDIDCNDIFGRLIFRLMPNTGKVR